MLCRCTLKYDILAFGLTLRHVLFVANTEIDMLCLRSLKYNLLAFRLNFETMKPANTFPVLCYCRVTFLSCFVYVLAGFWCT